MDKQAKKNLVWMIELFLFLAGFYYVYRNFGGREAQPKSVAGNNATKTVAAASTGSNLRAEVTLETAVVCIDVDEATGKPLLAKGVFSRYIDHLYCYAEFSGVITEAVFDWRYKGASVAQKRERVKRNQSAAWSLMDMSAEQAGEWQVEIRTVDGRLLGSAPFILK